LKVVHSRQLNKQKQIPIYMTFGYFFYNFKCDYSTAIGVVSFLSESKQLLENLDYFSWGHTECFMCQA
jgi:hypothetical protein